MNDELRNNLSLKRPERAIDKEEPWSDDKLERKKVAQALTNLVSRQSEPLVVSLHGDWGTGKTFLLKRWQHDLGRNNNFKSIYFNAWEDDFHGDPLVAIIGQLSDALDDVPYKTIIEKVKKSAKPLLAQSALGVIAKTTGINLHEALEKIANGALTQYSKQQESKKELKEQLNNLSEKVKKETGNPLVFIIDELDRCRPTFAIELLERVKHIFDIPDIVFVLGVNRGELCKAISSVYGEIDSDVYLRRFFDMEFTIPESNAEVFCLYLIYEYKLQDYFDKLTSKAKNKIHQHDCSVFSTFFPKFCSYLGLSLRDIDYCIRSITFVGKTIKERHSMQPTLVGILIILRLKNPILYRNFVQEKSLAGAVMDYLDEQTRKKGLHDQSINEYMTIIETHLYTIKGSLYYGDPGKSNSFSQLELLLENKALTHPEYLSKKTQGANKERVAKLIGIAEDLDANRGVFDPSIGYLSSIIELVAISQK